MSLPKCLCPDKYIPYAHLHASVIPAFGNRCLVVKSTLAEHHGSHHSLFGCNPGETVVQSQKRASPFFSPAQKPAGWARPEKKGINNSGSGV
jgi:hypothetical protein